MTRLIVEIFQQKRRLTSAILLLLLINLILAVVISAYQELALANLQTEWSALRRQTARAGQLDAVALYHKGTADLDKLKARIPQKEEFTRVLSELYEEAESSAVEVGSISYKPVPIKEEALLAYQLTLSVNGSYAAVKSFLADLQKRPELLVIDSVAFANNDLFVENVVMDLHITVFFRERT